jgi:polysaccharide biosynthesis transport protein
MDLKEYVRVLRAHLFLIVAAVVVCTGAAALLVLTETPTYAAHTQLFVSATGASADLSQTYQGGLFAQIQVQSYAQIVSSPAVLSGVVEQLGLSESVQKLQSEITASVPTGTILINVTVRNPSPERARAIADALAVKLSSFIPTLDAGQDHGSSSIKVSVTVPAELPTHPVSPRKTVDLTLGVLLGLIVGVGGAVAREAFDRRVRDENDVARITGTPLLGVLDENPKAGRERLVLMDDPFSFDAEAYRQLRTNLLAVSVERDLRSIVVSSPADCHAKTLVAANLAIAFAQAGHRVVLIEADLRRPKLAEVLGLASSEGLSDVLADGLPVDTALQNWRDGLPLLVLGSGPLPPNPSDLLGSQRLVTLLETLADSGDLVILDAPPLLPVTDSVILARVTSGVLFVTEVGRSRTADLEMALEALRPVDAHVLGVVLTGVPTRRSGRYSRSRSWAEGNGAAPSWSEHGARRPLAEGDAHGAGATSPQAGRSRGRPGAGD